MYSSHEINENMCGDVVMSVFKVVQAPASTW